MNEREKQLFEALRQDRLENDKILSKPSMKGVKHQVVEKYSDSAHFVYELLQNADDAKASFSRFILGSNKLIFIHDGKRQFDVSDPKTEDDDKKEGKLGDINAITSVGNSSKEASKSTIGKFGVGFKAVFQYTSTPYIYSDRFRFKINKFIVPEYLENDHPIRNRYETLFEFPFNHAQRNAQAAYADIKNKLYNLKYPILFLENLQSVSFEIDGVYAEYKKS